MDTAHKIFYRYYRILICLSGVVIALAVLKIFQIKYSAFIFNNSYHEKLFAVEHESVPAELMKRVGWISTDRTSSFIHKNPEKPEGILRIGCFGDSFTYGSEVSDKLDYPYLLEKELEDRGLKNVEILNFGIGAYGFFQSYFLWDNLAEKYSLDYIVFGPSGFDYDRDSSFNFSPDAEKVMLHARYILKGSSIRRVELVGKTPEKMLKEYLRLIPRIQYLLYDYRSPAFLRCITPGYESRRNPFYYRKDMEEEIFQIHKILMKKISDKSGKLFIFHDSFNSLQKNEKEKWLSPGTYVSDRNDPYRTFPYAMPGGHLSGVGNLQVARYVADAVLNSKGAYSGKLITFHDISQIKKTTILPDRAALNSYAKIIFKINNNDFAAFANKHSHFHYSLPHSNLIAFKHKDISIADAWFFPVEIIAGEIEGSEVYARYGNKNLYLGKMHQLNPGLDIFYLNIDNIDNPGSGSEWILSDVLSSLIGVYKDKKIEIIANDSVLFDININNGRISEFDYYRIFPLPDSFFKPEELAEGTQLCIELLGRDGNKQSVPVAESRLNFID